MTVALSVAIEQRKLTSYLLNVDHPVGRSKARFFIGHGFDPADPKSLADALNDHAANYWPGVVSVGQWATKHVLTGDLLTPRRSVVRVLTVWQMKSDGYAWFVTARPA